MQRTLFSVITPFLLWLLAICNVHEAVLADDAEKVRSLALGAIQQVAEYKTYKIVAERKMAGRVNNETWYATGSKIWLEHSSREPNEAEEQEKQGRLAALRKITGCDLPLTRCFDGRRTYAFDPYNLELRIEPSTGMSGVDDVVLPASWLVVGPGTPFSKLLDGSYNGETTAEQLEDGRWRFSQRDIGASLSLEVQARLSQRNRFIVVDPQLGYLVTEHGADGGTFGTYRGNLVWAKQDGRWYVKNSKLVVNDMLVREWTITEISFDARDCEKPYTRFETYIPFATKIEELGADGKVTRVRYKGGDQGKEEFDLIYLTIVKWRIEN